MRRAQVPSRRLRSGGASALAANHAGPRPASQQLPGFPIVFVAVAVASHLLFADRTQHQAQALSLEDYSSWNDVPNLFGDDVCREEIDFTRRVSLSLLVGSESAEIAVGESVACRLHLYSDELPAVFDPDVVGRRVSPRLRHSESLT